MLIIFGCLGLNIQGGAPDPVISGVLTPIIRVCMMFFLNIQVNMGSGVKLSPQVVESIHPIISRLCSRYRTLLKNRNG